MIRDDDVLAAIQALPRRWCTIEDIMFAMMGKRRSWGVMVEDSSLPSVSYDVFGKHQELTRSLMRLKQAGRVRHRRGSSESEFAGSL